MKAGFTWIQCAVQEKATSTRVERKLSLDQIFIIIFSCGHNWHRHHTSSQNWNKNV